MTVRIAYAITKKTKIVSNETELNVYPEPSWGGRF